MTALIGGSLLMIAGATIALVFGWLGADPTLMWVSIGASVAAGVMLALGYNRSKVEVAAATRAFDARRTERGPPRDPADVTHGPPAEEEEEDEEEEGDEVIARPERKRFHRPECRYAKVPGGEAMSAATARRRGYDPCGICKP